MTYDHISIYLHKYNSIFLKILLENLNIIKILNIKLILINYNYLIPSFFIFIHIIYFIL